MLRRLASRLSYANVVATLALFFALGGGAFAALSLPRNSVGSKQLKSGAVTNKKLAARAVTGGKVALDTLTGANIKASTLGAVPNANHAIVADQATAAANATNATNATNAAQLGGIAAASYQQKCTDGAIKGFVLVHGSATFPNTYTTDPSLVSSPFNCGGGIVEAKRNSAGNYEVKFVGNTSSLALGEQTKSTFVGFVEVESDGGPGQFEVFDSNGAGGNADTGFILALL
jgi:hypothetical protein